MPLIVLFIAFCLFLLTLPFWLVFAAILGIGVIAFFKWVVLFLAIGIAVNVLAFKIVRNQKESEL